VNVKRGLPPDLPAGDCRNGSDGEVKLWEEPSGGGEAARLRGIGDGTTTSTTDREVSAIGARESFSLNY